MSTWTFPNRSPVTVDAQCHAGELLRTQLQGALEGWQVLGSGFHPAARRGQSLGLLEAADMEDMEDGKTWGVTWELL